ncbi:MAG TPA: methyltransferase domain-containing protein [bacterium]|nr:methyltransferase domain-containing protein [bacterium]HQG58523.1 methyltransferase domain-containing protein [bacterium]HQG79060.1 methyltransferase domain-containing protein [bacterium]HQK41764.1 methyltransferase domain-containing protein [bacterium]
MSIKSYYENYWKGDISGKSTDKPPEWSSDNLNWHYHFFKKYMGKKVLDAGAGDGTFLNFLLDKHKEIDEAVALELSEEAIEIGKKKFPKMEFKQGSLENIPFSENCFDTVFAIEVLEHLLDIDQCLSEIYRVLKPGGFFCATTTDFNLLKKVVIAIFFWNRFFYPNNPHIRFFTKKTLIDISKKHGFKLVDYKWNRSYFGLMPKGQMVVFQKIDLVSHSQTYFAESYDTRTFYPPDDVKFSVYSTKIWEEFLDTLPVEGEIADFGCGEGTLLYCLEEKGFKNLYGIDFIDVVPDGFLKHAKFLKGDVLGVPLEDKSLDGVVSTMVIEHVDERKFIEEVHRVLKKDGVALITSVLKGKFSWYFYKNSKGETVVEPTHLKEYRSVKEYEDLFKDGFEVLLLRKPTLKYPLVDPVYRLVFKLTRSEKLRKLFTTNIILKKLRGFRIPIPGYYSIEILVRKK